MKASKKEKMDKTEDDEDRRIEELLDAVDERTKIQTKLHDALSNGFMWIARERYRDALATYRLQNVVSDARTIMQSNVRVSVDDNARNTNADDKSVSFTKWEEDDVCPSHGNNSDTVATPLDSGIRRRRHAQQKPGASTTKESQLLNARTDDDEEDDGGSVSQGTGRRRRGTPVMAMPSKEVREAVRCFNESIEHAMRLASENSTLNTRTISS